MKHRSDKYIAGSRTYPGPQPYKLGCSGSWFQRWLGKLNWHYSKMKNGMFIDGHEREDIIAY
jgi:hypothetical protein